MIEFLDRLFLPAMFLTAFSFIAAIVMLVIYSVRDVGRKAADRLYPIKTHEIPVPSKGIRLFKGRLIVTSGTSQPVLVRVMLMNLAVLLSGAIVVVICTKWLPEKIHRDFVKIVSGISMQNDKVFVDEQLIEEPLFLVSELGQLEYAEHNGPPANDCVIATIEIIHKEGKKIVHCFADETREDQVWLYQESESVDMIHWLGTTKSPELFAYLTNSDTEEDESNSP